MSPSWMLRRGERVDGVRAVEILLRSARMAFLIPDDDAAVAVKAVQSCCLSWGGYANYLIPYSRTAGIADEWLAVLRVLDPDAVVDCGGVLLDVDKGFFDNRGWHVRDWEDPSSTLFVGEALQYSAMLAFAEGLEKPDAGRFVVLPELDEKDELYLPLVARFGSLNEEPFKIGVHRLRPRLLRPGVGYADFAQIKAVDFSGHSEDVLLGRVPADRIEGDWGEPLKLTELTRAGLATRGSGWSGESTPERPEPEEAHANRVVVTGDPRSVEDLALYWNLRAENPFADPFPLWVPLDLLDEAFGEQIVEEATRRMDAKVGDDAPWRDTLQVLSASVHRARLAERLARRFPNARIGVERTANLFAGEWSYYLAQEQQPVAFEEGNARIKLPRPEAFDDFVPTLDRAVYEVGVDGVWLPQSETLLRRGVYGHSASRITKRGTLEYLEYVGSRSPRSGLLNLTLPDGWTVLSSLLEDRGYECRPSPKSETALGQVSLLGGLRNLAITSSSKVHRLLRELSQRAAEERGFLAERKTLDYNSFRRHWGDEAAPRLLPWMIDRRVLFRGADISCPKCRLRRWYEVDRIGHTWRCDGCQEEQPVPLGLGSTGWKYRINELYASGYDQGTVTPLLVLYRMQQIWGSSFARAGLAFYPGIEYEARPSASVPVERGEVDLVALLRGRLILVECKESGEPFARPDEARKLSEKLRGLASFAEHLEASRIMVATATSFPEDKGPLLEHVPAAWAERVEWWDGEELLDPDPRLTPRDGDWRENYLSRVFRIADPLV